MASNFPKLPGYVPNHDPTIVSHKKVSHVKLEKNRNGNNVEVPLYAVPKPPSENFRPEKTEMSKSLSQTQYVNHLGGTVEEQFEPTFVKLDKQVSNFPFRSSTSPSLASRWARATRCCHSHSVSECVTSRETPHYIFETN